MFRSLDGRLFCDRFRLRATAFSISSVSDMEESDIPFSAIFLRISLLTETTIYIMSFRVVYAETSTQRGPHPCAI